MTHEAEHKQFAINVVIRVVNVMECIKDSDTLSCYEPFTFI